MNNLNDNILNAKVIYSQGSVGTSLNLNQVNCSGYWDYWYRPYYYPIYTESFCKEKSKVEMAFELIGVLLEKKIIEKALTVKEFIELTNDVAKLL